MKTPEIIAKTYLIPATTTSTLFSTFNAFDAVLREIVVVAGSAGSSVVNGIVGIAFAGDQFNQTFAVPQTVNDLNNFNMIAIAPIAFDGFISFHPNIFVGKQRVLNMWCSSTTAVASFRAAVNLYFEVLEKR